MKKKYNFPILYFEGTRLCNLNCSICMSGANNLEFVNQKKKDELSSLDILNLLLKPSLELGVKEVYFSGGEFILRKDAFEIIEFTHKLGLKIKVLTNGSQINSEILNQMKKIAGRNIELVFGINSISENEINKETRKYDIENILKVFELCKVFKISKHVVVNIGKFNLNDLESTLLWLEKNRIPFNRSPLVPRNSGRNFFDKNFFTHDDMEKIIHPSLVKRINGYLSYTPFFLSPNLHKEVSGGKAFNGNIPQNPFIGCWVGSWIAASPEGDISPCATLIDEVVAGNVRHKSLYDIISSSKIFNDLLDRDKLKGKCGICRYNRTCGGCRAIAYYHTGDYLAEDPTCFFNPVDKYTISSLEEETNKNFKKYLKVLRFAGLYKTP